MREITDGAIILTTLHHAIEVEKIIAPNTFRAKLQNLALTICVKEDNAVTTINGEYLGQILRIVNVIDGECTVIN